MFTHLKTKAADLAIASLIALLAFATPAAAQVTSLTMQSDPTDYIGLGQTYNYGSADATFTPSVNDTNSALQISVITPNFDHWWYIVLSSGNGSPLVPGTYLNAKRYIDGYPVLDVFGDGRGCNETAGSFQILQAQYGPGNTLLAFEATFEQHCEGAAAALRGRIRYNASVALYLTAPTTLQAIQGQNVSFSVTGTDVAQRRVYLTAPQLPPGATFVDNGNSTASFSWTPSASQSGQYMAIFQGDNKQGNIDTATTQITVIPLPPSNDDFATPVRIPSSPARYTADVTNATSAPDDPWCVYSGAQSVWYAFTAPTNMYLEANTLGSSFDTALSVYTGSRGALNQIACNDNAANTMQSRVRFAATAGTTYYFMAASPYYPSPAANLVFNLQPGPPPFSFTATVAQFGTVVASTGAVTIRGSLKCSQPAYVLVSGQLKQRRGKTAVTGYWSAFVPCDGVTAWSAQVQSQTQLFKGRSALLYAGGKAEVGATASAIDPDTGVPQVVNFQSMVTLRGK